MWIVVLGALATVVAVLLWRRLTALEESVSLLARQLLDLEMLTQTATSESRSLASQVHMLERQMHSIRHCTDAEFRRNVQRFVPLPLQQVYSFSLSLQPRFWLETLKVTPDELATADTWGGPIPHLLTIERWRSHRVVLLYEAKSSTPTRVLFLKGHTDSETTSLGRLTFGKGIDWKWLELFLEDDSLSLGFVGGTFGRGIRHSVDGPLEGPTPAGTFFRLPLRSPDALRKYHHTSPDVDGAPYPRHETDYEHADEVNGLRWYLHIDDLQREHEFWTAETLPEE